MYLNQSEELLDVSNDGLLAYLARSVQQISRMYLQLLNTQYYNTFLRLQSC